MESTKNLTKHESYEGHGFSRRSIYGRWHGMVGRCHNSRHPAYKNYGGRGITVCQEWRDSARVFIEHVTRLPNYGKSGYSIDRIDNDAGYFPGNVRWATRIEQAANRRSSALPYELSRAEKDIVRLMACGIGYRDIARLREGNERTIRTQAVAIMKTIGATNRVQAALYALRNNLISVDQAWIISLLFQGE